jgi:hypothetical protein
VKFDDDALLDEHFAVGHTDADGPPRSLGSGDKCSKLGKACQVLVDKRLINALVFEDTLVQAVGHGARGFISSSLDVLDSRPDALHNGEQRRRV